jgi:hypothetical protein
MPIITQPISQAVQAGGTLVLSVAWNGSPSTFRWYKDGVLLSTSGDWTITSVQFPHPSPHGTSTLTKVNFGTPDVGEYYADIIGVGTSNTAVVTTNTPILDRIEKRIEALVGGMKIADGYNFDWGIVNEQDESIGDFPRCVIDPSDMVADKESNMDTLAGIGSRDYTNEVMFTLLIKGELPAFDTNPLFAARSVLRKAHDDLKRLFGIHLNLDSECDNILYVGSQIESLVRNDVQRPAQLRTFWKVIYSQDRQTPTQYASS